MREEICVNSNACLTLYVFDSFGDGMCCGYGEGNFQVSNSSGETIVFNDGDFDSEAIESFCMGDAECDITATVDVEQATSSSANDGIIVINTASTADNFEFSIDGGLSFGDSNTFGGLSVGAYDVVVQNETGICTYTETVFVDVCDFTDLDVTVTHPTSVLTTDGSIVILPVSAEGSYQYSIDGGQNFVETGTFMNLPVGEYNVEVMDNLSTCVYEFERLLMAIGVNHVDDAVVDDTFIKIYPNPTSDQFNIEIESSGTWDEPLQIMVLDRLGRVLETSSIPNGATRKTISLNGYAPGTYFVKCFTQTFEQNFKVIKV